MKYEIETGLIIFDLVLHTDKTLDEETIRKIEKIEGVSETKILKEKQS